MEFLTVFGFVFLMLIPLIVIFFSQSGQVQDTISENQIKNINKKIADVAEEAYYSGEPTKFTIKAYFPEKLEYINISGRTIRSGYRSSENLAYELFEVSAVNITGNISVSPGPHIIEITASGDQVIVEDK